MERRTILCKGIHVFFVLSLSLSTHMHAHNYAHRGQGQAHRFSIRIQSEYKGMVARPAVARWILAEWLSGWLAATGGAQAGGLAMQKRSRKPKN